MVSCMICVEELSPSSSDVVVFTLCRECEEVYCRRCLEEWLNKYERTCPRCKRADERILRRSKPIGCGRERLVQMMEKTSAEVVKAPVVAPEPGELRRLAEAMIDPAFKRKREDEDRDEESLALAKKLAEDELREEQKDEEFARKLQEKEVEERRRQEEREAKDAEFARTLAAQSSSDLEARTAQQKRPRRSSPSPLLSMFHKNKKVKSHTA